MLELHPTCEKCHKSLPPNSLDARICSFECTYCAECVEKILFYVCPNCGGGFAPWPIRPKHEYRPGAYLAAQPAATNSVENAVVSGAHALFAAGLKDIPPRER